MLIDEATQHFLQAVQADGLAVATLKWYDRCLRQLAERFKGCKLTSVTAPDMRQLIIDTRNRQTNYRNRTPNSERPLSEQSVRSYITAWFRFWSWCASEYGITNPTANIRKPKMVIPKPTGVSEDDFQKLIRATHTQGDKEHGIRDRAILFFLMDTAARAGGLIGLKWDDVDLVHRRAQVTEKGDKERTVYFSETTATALHQWKRMHPAKCSEVFCNLQHRRYGRALTYDGLHNILEKRALEAGCTGKITPHKFRHESARRFVMNGGDLSVLKQLMGHTDIHTTAMYYAVFNDSELADSHDKHNPLEKKEGKTS